MQTWNLYDDTGFISGYAKGSVTIIDGRSMLEGEIVSGKDFYVVSQSMTDTEGTISYNPTVTPRPIMAIATDKTSIPADSTTTAKITGVPAGASVFIEGETHTVNDGEIDFTADHVGDYVLKFTLFPYKPFTLTITGTAT